MPTLSTEHIKTLLSEIPDPEIPVISIIDLGILRDVQWKDDLCNIIITPTYSGCPAMKVIEDNIRQKLKDAGIKKINIELAYTPAWTTDWISDEAKEKLLKYGIAPPLHSSIDKGVLLGKERLLHCPLCNSKNTELISQFGSTACKALYRCKDCKEPFDYFKCL
ncbi:MAG TPA: 1,2-phenylacetyl-CoA epoxidase subunit PaaD [Bacteroidia bacterium]|nr:1,2-phenylacetyl-CoA epoxidase subunit PaaD [Bacteroidia bacterium]